MLYGESPLWDIYSCLHGQFDITSISPTAWHLRVWVGSYVEMSISPRRPAFYVQPFTFCNTSAMIWGEFGIDYIITKQEWKPYNDKPYNVP